MGEMFMDGIIVVNKEKGCTSRDVVNSLSKILGTKKIGHTGTLDPMATGVLVVCVGKCTRLVEMITSDYKEYVAGVKLGVMTDTLDITGSVSESCVVDVTKDDIIRVLDSFRGEYLQEVPIYSAVKINGKKLYEYARSGIDVQLPKRVVDIKNISLIDFKSSTDFTIKCTVSKGTYIRSLVRDIALRLGTIGVMSSLVRTKQGNFNIEDAYSLSDIESGNYSVIGVRDYFKDMYTVNVDADLKRKVLNGCILDNNYDCDIIMFTEGELVLAIYKDYGGKLKPYKMFGGIR